MNFKADTKLISKCRIQKTDVQISTVVDMLKSWSLDWQTKVAYFIYISLNPSLQKDKEHCTLLCLLFPRHLES